MSTTKNQLHIYWGKFKRSPRTIASILQIWISLLLDRIAFFILRVFPWVVARLVSYMARSGDGTDACLKLGSLPMSVHYYSPVPDIQDLEARQVWSRRSPMAGVDFRHAAQLELLAQLGHAYGDECWWPLKDPGDPAQFYLNPDFPFSFGCAAATHSMVRHFKPRRVIEFGSGYSSKVLAASLRQNANLDPAYQFEYTIIEPYPRPPIEEGKLPGVTRLHRMGAEKAPIELFDTLQANDILFIDSGHVVRIASDVNYAILDILPRLKPGVLVHFHDVPMPFEYHKVYYTGHPAFRVFWTESYLLQAFLIYNNQFEVLLALKYLMEEQKDKFAAAFPHFDPQSPTVSESFWIRRAPAL
jgi:hypothetical protein